MYTNNTIQSDKALSLCFEYSEDKKQLKDLLNNLNISAINHGTIKNKWESNLNSLHWTITIKNLTNNKDISFDFFGSHKDCENWNKRKIGHSMRLARKKIVDNLLYSVLCSCRCDFFIEPLFEEFCSDFGYDEDSRKHFDLWQVCLKHSYKLNQVFNENDMECLPL